MTHIFLSNLKSTLDNCITELDEIHSMFCRNPESDFTRNRKLSFREYIQFMLQMQSKSVSNEILDFFEHSLSAPSKSAFTQQRYKLLPEGWNFLFHSFVKFRIARIRLDNGTYICIATNLSEEEFLLEEINKLYRMRWSEETSFRELKYTIGLINWHSSKYDEILQEINARMILYNFRELVPPHAVVKLSPCIFVLFILPSDFALGQNRITDQLI